MSQSHRHTIDLVTAPILSHERFDGEQYLLRVHAPEIAATARAGSFVHITVDPQRPLRRPISIDPERIAARWPNIQSDSPMPRSYPHPVPGNSWKPTPSG